jgi:DNA-binding NarL/FixJ family response regulator
MDKINCIVVEDDPGFQTIIKSLINKIPELNLVNIFDNSVDAALFITRQKPHLIFMDVEIGGLTGLEVFDSLDYKPKTIVITADGSYAEEAKELEVDGFLTKPIADFNVFHQAVMKVIQEIKPA